MRILLLLLAVIAVCYAQSSNNCTSLLCGVYQNQMGSTMKITSASNSMFAGTYESAVGKAKGKYKLVGAYSGEELPATIGWTVTWNSPSTPNGTSTTSWTGVIAIGTPEKCRITNTCDPSVLYFITQWHLAMAVNPQNYWQSTLSGLDVFQNVTSGY